jgi:hypothetical protein
MGLHLFSLPPGERYLLLGIVILIIFGIRLGPLLFSRGKPRAVVPLGTARNYGLAGGTICPHCHRPFTLSLLDLKLGFGYKLAHCPFCGHWSLSRRRSPAELSAAEAAELAEAKTESAPAGQSEAEKTRALLDETRYTDHK